VLARCPSACAFATCAAVLPDPGTAPVAGWRRGSGARAALGEFEGLSSAARQR